MSDVGSTTPVRRGSGAFFGLMVGLFLGVLVAALVVPDRQAVDVVSAPTAETAAPQAVTSGAGAPGTPEADPAEAPATSGAAAPAAAEAPAAAPGAPAAAGRPAEASYVGDGMPVVAERGVTEDNVTIGIALIDTGPLGAAPQYNQGDPEKFYDAILKAWKGSGALPVHGRNVTFIYRRYSVLDNNQQRAACKDLIEDRKSFAIVGTVLWQVGADCSAKELKTPTLTSDAVHERTLASGAPYMFSLAMSEDRQLRNVAHWAHTKKLLKGKVGVYFHDESIEAELVRRTLIGQLKKLGHTVVEATTNTTQSSQNDLLAVRRFQQERAETVFLLVSREGFLNAAQGQGYKPRYLDTDHQYGTTDAQTSRFPAEQFEGTLAFTGRRGGEFQAKYPRTPEQRRCVETYRAHTGETLEDDSFKFQMAMHSCDTGDVILAALRRAGPNLTRASFVAALETIKNQPLARSGSATFGPGKHHGADFYRTLQWQSSCRCFKAIEDFRPLLVP